MFSFLKNKVICSDQLGHKVEWLLVELGDWFDNGKVLGSIPSTIQKNQTNK
jgi:hypothetical protein